MLNNCSTAMQYNAEIRRLYHDQTANNFTDISNESESSAENLWRNVQRHLRPVEFGNVFLRCRANLILCK